MTHNEPPFETPALQIGHPIHKDWLVSGLDLMADPDSPHQQALRERFGESETKLRQLVQTIGSISLHLDSKRGTHESANVHVLRVITNDVVSPEAFEEYKSLAGRPELAGKYIVWFGRVATVAYANYFRLLDNDPETLDVIAQTVGGRKNFLQIGVDLGGKRQAGNWNGTADLDTWADGLGDAIKTAEPAAEVDVCKAPAEQLRGYKLFPLYKTNEHGLPERDYTSATIRRRRRHSVVRMPGLRQLVVIKESTGWIQLDEVENGREGIIVSEALQAWDDNEHGQENSPVAKVGGKIFERAIHQRDHTREVIPLHAHYYVLASVDMPVV